ncbi:MAG TPA: hypothetical protein VKR32_07555 [Puia sp.]|nr:hypothetical protein [Puia sp.]
MKSRSILFVLLLASALTADAQSDLGSQFVQNTFADLIPAQGSHIYPGSFLPQMQRQVDTRGSRFLFNNWVSGIVTDTGNHTVDNPAYLYNYDKIDKSLLLTLDKRTVLEINYDAIKSVILDSGVRKVEFESLPSIENGHLVECLAKGSRYCLYKALKTKFVRSDYFSDGLVERGDPDNCYVDEATYYVFNKESGEMRLVVLKKKVLKEVFAREKPKLNGYFSQHKDEETGEEYLQGLVEFLNQ